MTSPTENESPPPCGEAGATQEEPSPTTAESVASSGEDCKPRARSLKPRDEGPYLWLSKAAEDRIGREGGESSYQTLHTVYCTLCRIASDKGGNPSFSAFMASIAGRARLTTRATRSAIRQLKAIGLVASEPRYDGNSDKPNTASVYTLLSTLPTPKGGRKEDSGEGRKRGSGEGRKVKSREAGNRSQRSDSASDKTWELEEPPRKGEEAPLNSPESSHSEDNLEAPISARACSLDAAARTDAAPQAPGKNVVHKPVTGGW